MHLQLLCILSLLVSSSAAIAECGIVSTYGKGKTTASGERFGPHGMTAAHRKLPFNTRISIYSKRTGGSIVARINDRGPYVKGRLLDLSTGAARAAGVNALAPVCFRVLSYGGSVAETRKKGVHGKEGLSRRLAAARFLRRN